MSQPGFGGTSGASLNHLFPFSVHHDAAEYPYITDVFLMVLVGIVSHSYLHKMENPPKYFGSLRRTLRALCCS